MLLHSCPLVSEKVSLLLSCAKQNNRDWAVPPTFRLNSGEDLARALSRIRPENTLFRVHIDLKKAFKSFRLPSRVRRFFRFRPGIGLLPVELEHVAFRWKYSPHFCQIALARVLQGLLPLGCCSCTILTIFCSSTPNRGTTGRWVVCCVGCARIRRGRVFD